MQRGLSRLYIYHSYQASQLALAHPVLEYLNFVSVTQNMHRVHVYASPY